MRILHINLVYLPAYRYGGPIISVHNLNKWLVKNGADVTVYTTTIDGPDNLDVPVGVPVDLDGVHVYYFQPTNFLRRWFYSRDLHRFLAEHIREFDLIHVTAVFTAATVLVHHYAKKYNKPYIVSPRGSLMKEPLERRRPLVKQLYLRFIENRNLRDAAAIHFTTEQERQEYVEQGFPMRDSFVIPNGLDPEETKPRPGSFREKYGEKLGISNDKKIVLFLGRINWKKGLDDLIPAFGVVKKEYENCVLVIAGGNDEGYRSLVESWIRERGLQNDVKFTDILLGDDKKAAYNDADVFVLPSYSENFGMSVVESMQFGSLSHGTTTIVTENVGIAPSIRDANAGIVVKKNIDDLANAILLALKDENLSREKTENARKLVQKEFLMPAIADKFMEEYRLIFNSKT